MNKDNLNNDKKMNLILENETTNNKKETWTKLGKTEKILKLNSYVDMITQKENINDTNKMILKKYLIDALDRKRLTSVKDVIYDKDEGIIKDIPTLVFNTNSNKYTLKRSDKKKSTIKSLQTHKSKIKIIKEKNKDKN